MVNIPPLVFFYWAAKIGGEIQTKKLSKRNLLRIAIGIGFVEMEFLDLPICLPE